MRSTNVTWTEWFFRGDKPQRLQSKLDLLDLSIEFPHRLRSSGRLDTDRTDSTVTSIYIATDDALTETTGERRRYVVKVFSPYTLADAQLQCARLGIEPSDDNIARISEDANPFVCESRAYHQIQKYCSSAERNNFSTFYGTGIVPWTLREFGNGTGERPCVVLAVFDGTDTRRYLKPIWENQHTFSDFDADLTQLGTDPVARLWYRSVLFQRQDCIDILHEVGVIHGDIKNDSFQIPNNIHDVGCYDFSLSYTFTERQPLVMNGRRRLTPYAAACEIDKRSLVESVLQLARRKTFELYMADQLKTNEWPLREVFDSDISNLRNWTPDVVICRAKVSKGYLFFPSFASLLPLLEPKILELGALWFDRFARTIGGFVALWISYKPCSRTIIRPGAQVLVDSTCNCETLFNVALVPPNMQSETHYENICRSFAISEDANEETSIQLFSETCRYV